MTVGENSGIYVAIFPVFIKELVQAFQAYQVILAGDPNITAIEQNWAIYTHNKSLSNADIKDYIKCPGYNKIRNKSQLTI